MFRYWLNHIYNFIMVFVVVVVCLYYENESVTYTMVFVFFFVWLNGNHIWTFSTGQINTLDNLCLSRMNYTFKIETFK